MKILKNPIMIFTAIKRMIQKNLLKLCLKERIILIDIIKFIEKNLEN